LRDSLELGALTVEDCMEPLRMPKMDVLHGDASGGGGERSWRRSPPAWRTKPAGRA